MALGARTSALTSPARHRWTARTVVVLMVAVLALAVSNLIGWATAVSGLTRLMAAWPHLPPWGAVLLTALAVSVLAQVGSPARWRVVLARALSVGAATVAAVMLVEYGLDATWGIDRWWFGAALDAVHSPYPGRISPQSAVGIVLLAILVGLIRVDARPWPATQVALFVVALVIPAMALLGYLLVGRPLLPVSAATGVTVAGALGALAVGVGAALSRPDRAPVATYLDLPYRGALTRLLAVLAGTPVVVALVRHASVAAGLPSDEAWVAAVGVAAVVVGLALVIALRRELTLSQERQSALDQALRAEHRYRLLAENASDAVFEMGAAESRYTWMSPSIEGLLGWRPDEVIATSPIDLVDPLDAPRLRAEIAAVAAGEVRHYRARYRTRAGGTRWLDVTARPILDSAGALVGRVGSYRDAQAAVVLEQDLAAGEERFRAAMTNAPGGMALVAPDGRLLTVNPSFCRMLDRTESAMVSSSWQELTHPDDVGADQAMVDAILAGERDSYRIVKRYLRPDGSIVWGDLGVGCVRDEAGNVTTFISQIVDVTREHRAAEALAESESRYRLLAENVTDVVCHLRAGLIEWASASATSVWGAGPEHWVGTAYADLIHPTDRTELAELVTLAEAGEAATRRGRFRVADGSYHWMEAHFGPFLDEDGRMDGAIASVRNVDREVAVLDELAAFARVDTLTGLLNRRAALEHLRSETEQRRPGGGLAVLFCDVDRFKSVNDDHGHAAGDAVLRTIAGRIAATVRLDDIVARIGGDELLVLLTGAHGLDEARAVAEKIRVRVAEPIEVDGAVLSITMSIGVTMHSPHDEVDALLARADSAMYEAKQAGRDRVVVVG